MDYSLKVLAVFVFYFISVISAQGGSYNGYGKILGSSSGQSSDRGCIACKTKGRYYSPNAKFSYIEDCFTYNCFCYCNGTYVCPAEDTLYTCGNTRDRNTGNTRGTSGQIGGSSGGQRRGDCRFCTPDNTVERIPPNTYFNYKNGCLEYTDCFCGCDGFWQCSNNRVIDSCPASSGHGVILGASDNNDGSCRRCNAHGKIVAADTYFTYRNGCMEWFNCRCECDGSWQCPSDQGRWICENVCRECDINGTIHRANTDFRYTKDCFEYYPCHCHCNGSWHCPAENGRWICTDQCRTCDVKGMIKQGDTSFTYREDCWEWENCMCHCNGSWRCPTENARWACTSRCLECNVNGTRYKGNSVFQVTKGCYQFNCDCGCDGGWDCPSNRTIDVCNMNATTMCYFCDVHGTRYQGNSFFSHKDGCINYTNCVCNCDGSWDCPGRSAIDTCRQNTTTGCYYCDVRGRQFQGQSRFQLEEDCWRFECECDCNGIWRCSEERAEYTCGQTIRPGTCRECYAGGNRYAPRQPFVLPWGCINYNCHCNCDGSWICPAANADIRCSSGSFQKFQIATISSTPNSWCKECLLNGQVYPGNSQFEYESNCVKHSFRCYCNGGYRKTFGVMGSCTKQILSGSISSSSTGVITSGSTSCTCIINGKTYPENSEVEMKVGCASYSCRCTCNGFPKCRLVSNNLCRSVISAIGQTTVGSGGVVLGSSGGSVSRTSSGGTTIVVAGEKRGSTVERVVTSGSSGTGTVVVTGSTGGGTILTGDRGCGYCIVEGRRYEGGTSFQFKRDCMLFSCQCDCSRRAVCTTTVAADCMPRPVPEYCQECTVHGRRYPPKSYFEYRQDCELYRCQCGCNGRESCTSEFIENCRLDTCRPCNVNGKRRAPNSDFDLQDGCQRYRCHCKCNGIHKCSAPIDTCGGQPRKECRNCVLYGVTYPTNTPFLYERGCWRMRCNCDCDGYHNCDRRNAEYTCDINPPTPPPKQCTRCLSDGIYYEANKKFTRRRGCLIQRCQCFCDGRVQCVRTDLYTCAQGTVIEPGSSSSTTQTRVVVTGTRTSTSRTSRTRSGGAVRTSSTSAGTVQRDSNCTTCEADNIERNPGTTFYLDRGCNRYTCHCPCEGRFSCETGTPENLCDESGSRRCRNCVVSDKTYTANQRFQLDYDECRKYQCICNCNGTYDCPRNEIINTCQREPRCQNCHYNNQKFPPNTRFSYTKGCEKFNCSCECDGMVLCPDDLTVDICTIDNTAGTCRNCLVEGRTFPPNQRFQYDEDCLRKDCYCNCDGTWRCPDSNTRNICQTEREKCRPCEVMGRMYRSNEKFQYDDKCLRYDCDCLCNGTYVCPSERTINICRGSGMINYTHECTECSVNGKRYSPNTRFAYDENCYRFDCDCRCNGSWVCPGERTRYICDRVETTTDSARECLPCVINNRAYRPESRFQYDSSCERYDCDCLCNGTYVCPAERTRDLCGGRTESGKCTPCVVEGRTYRSNSRFQYDSECIRHDCDCYCNGTHVCPSERIRDFCGDRGGSEGGRDRCTACVVNGRKYRPKSRFRYDSDCNRFDCRCLCNGTYVCPAERTRDICGGGDRPDETRKCRPCVVNERSYRANTRFQYDSDCNRFDCDCRCDGSYVCPSERTRNICPGRGRGRDRDETGRCKHCTVEGRRYRTESRFQYESGCNRFDCDCRCDGSYVCPAERTRDICGGGGRGTGPDKTACKHCTVNGQTYRTQSKFQYERDCLRFDCDCFCNGSFNCPAERTRRVCNNDAPVNDDGSQYQNDLPKTDCVKCKVRGQTYDPETKFKYSRRCYQYDCHCQCDGFYKCAGKRLKKKCGGSRRCKKNCDVRGVTYPGNSIFVLREGCMQKQCHCKCNGKWKCNQSKTVNVCNEN